MPGGKGNSSGSVQSSPASLEALSHTCAPVQPQESPAQLVGFDCISGLIRFALAPGGTAAAAGLAPGEVFPNNSRCRS